MVEWMAESGDIGGTELWPVVVVRWVWQLVGVADLGVSPPPSIMTASVKASPGPGLTSMSSSSCCLSSATAARWWSPDWSRLT